MIIIENCKTWKKCWMLNVFVNLLIDFFIYALRCVDEKCSKLGFRLVTSTLLSKMSGFQIVDQVTWLDHSKNGHKKLQTWLMLCFRVHCVQWFWIFIISQNFRKALCRWGDANMRTMQQPRETRHRFFRRKSSKKVLGFRSSRFQELWSANCLGNISHSSAFCQSCG